MKLLKKTNEDKFSVTKILSIIGLILAIIVSGFTIYDRFLDEPDDEGLTIEQRLSPEMMKELKSGKTIRIEKGITLEESM